MRIVIDSFAIRVLGQLHGLIGTVCGSLAPVDGLVGNLEDFFRVPTKPYPLPICSDNLLYRRMGDDCY